MTFKSLAFTDLISANIYQLYIIIKISEKITMFIHHVSNIGSVKTLYIRVTVLYSGVAQLNLEMCYFNWYTYIIFIMSCYVSNKLIPKTGKM